MTRDPIARWALAVRVLLLVCAVLLTLSAVEARALRAARAELQQLRASCTATAPSR